VNPSAHLNTRTGCVRRLLVLLLLTLPVVAQAQFNYTTNNGTITITGYTGPGGVVVIPDMIDNLPVTGIGYAAFYHNTSLTSVTIGSSVTSIGQVAFDRCTSLTSVTIGSGVTSIGQYAFDRCFSLTEFVVDADNSTYSSVDGVLFDKNQTTLIQGPMRKAGDYTIPSGVMSIGGEAFYRNASLTSVTIPNSVTYIGSFAFERCVNLTNVTFGSGVTSIGYNAFSRTALTTVTIPNGVTYIDNQAFGNCASLTSVEIPSSVTGIGGSAFAGCANLASVTIPSSVTDIGVLAFASCASLNSVYFQGNAPRVGVLVFEGSAIVTVYYLPGTTGWDPTFGYRPTTLWVLPAPLILNNGPRFGVQTNRFGFIISWAMNLPVVVEACTDLAQPIWSPVGTNTLTDGSSYFSDPQWRNHPTRFYRLRSP